MDNEYYYYLFRYSAVGSSWTVLSVLHFTPCQTRSVEHHLDFSGKHNTRSRCVKS